MAVPVFKYTQYTRVYFEYTYGGSTAKPEYCNGECCLVKYLHIVSTI